MNDSNRGFSAQTMPEWTKRAIVWFWLTGLGVFYAVGALSALRDTLIVLFGSMFLSFAIEPAVDFLEKRRIRRGYGTAMVFLAVIAGITTMIATVSTALVAQVRELVDDAETYINDIQGWVNNTFNEDIDLNAMINEVLDKYLSSGKVQELIGSHAGDVLSAGAAMSRLLVFLAAAGLFTFYMVAEGPKFRNLMLSALDEERRAVALQVWNIAISKTGEYIYTRAVLATISTLVHWIAFTLLAVPSSLALAIWVGVVSQFIPAVGTYIAGALPVLITLLDTPRTGLLTLLVVVVYQQVENYSLAPRLTARTMNIHVTVAFGSVIVGIQLLGVVGAFLALPCAATLQALLSNWYATRQNNGIQQTDIPGENDGAEEHEAAL